MNKKLARGVLRLMLALQFTLVLSGCWERNELNEIAFVLGIGIDKAEKGYTVSMQVVIPSAITSQTNGGGEAVESQWLYINLLYLRFMMRCVS